MKFTTKVTILIITKTIAKEIKTSFSVTVGFKIPQYGHCLFLG
ncbi:MAG: hypothetical protein ACQERD_00395 [Campylobacterota bacterium]